MKSNSQSQSTCLLLLIAYVLSGKATLLLALPPGYATAIFPPAGIALAFAFTTGKKSLPWIFLSALLLNLWVGYSGHQPLNGLSAALIIATASMLQASAGAWLLHRTIKRSAALDNGRDLLALLLLAPVICVISASLSTGGLYALGLMDSPGMNWLTWWTGDTLGVLVMLPVTLTFIGEPRTLWRNRRLTLAIPVALMLAIIIGIFLRANKLDHEDSLSSFRLQSQQSFNQIQSSLDEQELVLQGMHGLFFHQLHGQVTRTEFARYTQIMLDRFPMIQAMEWAPQTSSMQRVAFETEQLPGFAIRERDASGKLQIAGNRNQYFPVSFVEPLKGNEPVLGFDLYSSPDRKTAVDRAINTLLPVATAPIKLVQGRDRQSGMLIMEALSIEGKTTGIILIVLKLHDFFDHALSPTNSLHQVRLTDLDSRQTLYNTFTVDHPNIIFDHPFTFASRHYLFESTPTDAYFKIHQSWHSWSILLMGCLGVSLAGGLLLLGTGYTEHVLQQVNLRTRELQDSKRLLLEILNTSPVAVRIARNHGREVIFCNHSYVKLVKHDHAIGIDPRNYYVNPQDYDHALAELAEGKTVIDRQIDLCIPDGSRVIALSSYMHIQYEGEQAVLAWFHDITAQKLSEERLRTLFIAIEQSPASVVITDLQANLQYVNPQFTQVTGYTPEEVLGKNPRILHSGLTSPEVYKDMWNKLTQGQSWQGELINRRKNGEIYYEETHISPVFNDHGETILFVGVKLDVTLRKLNEDELRLAASVYKNSSEGMMITDAETRIIAINSAFTHVTGYTLEDVLGKTPSILKSGRQSAEFYQDMWAQIGATGYWRGELWNRRKDGQDYAERLTINVEKQNDGSIYRYIALFSDITEQKKFEELIWNQANYDALSGLPNRRLFLDRLEQEARKCQRIKSSMGLLFIDLDRFKEINDTLGHAKGDSLLIEVAARIRTCIRDSDTLARLGGDEFTVILPEYHESSSLDRVAQKILIELSQPFDLGDGDIGHISASVGITMYPEDTDVISELLQYADQAMYAAKTAGRNGFSYFKAPMQKEALEKMLLTNDLRQALTRGELEVYYQPIIDVQSGKANKAEALLRWHHPDRGMISPVHFIPLAEESGLILEIGEWVFMEAIRNVLEWQKNTGQLIQVSVNKSPLQFLRGESHPWLEQLNSLDLPHGTIIVEITEGLLLHDSAKVRDELLDFKNRGIEVSIDDFGTGFSALSYLNQFDIDYLKVDRSFVKDMSANENSKALAEAIIVMAHKLGIKTIAEGVETHEQQEILVGFGCDYLQGYLYSRPVPANQFEKLITSGISI